MKIKTFSKKENLIMENKKMTYENPTVTKVEFDFSDRIAASGCSHSDMNIAMGEPICID